MMQLVFVSHGKMAEGTVLALESLNGRQPNVQSVCLTEDSNIEEFTRKINSVFDSVDEKDQLVVLCDILGGSPCSAVLTSLDERGL